MSDEERIAQFDGQNGIEGLSGGCGAEAFGSIRENVLAPSESWRQIPAGVREDATAEAKRNEATSSFAPVADSRRCNHTGVTMQV